MAEDINLPRGSCLKRISIDQSVRLGAHLTVVECIRYIHCLIGSSAKSPQCLRITESIHTHAPSPVPTSII